MTREPYDTKFYFRGNKIHNDIIESFQKRHPEFPQKADVHRHAIKLLDDEMRKNDGQDEMSLLIKKVGSLEHSNNALRVQVDVMIKVLMELLSRSGSDLTWEDEEQEIKNKIGSFVTKKSDSQLKQPTNFVRQNTKLKEESEKKLEAPSASKESLPMISDNDKIVMRNGDLCKIRMIGSREYYQKIEWEQIPKHRLSELE